MDTNGIKLLDLYSHYKFYHFFCICFFTGCGLALYRPYYSFMVPFAVSVFSGLAFELVGVSVGLPPHTKQCRGQPFHKNDAYWGLGVALLVAVLNLRSYHVYTMSYGSGIMAFAARGAVRKCNSLWEIQRLQEQGRFRR